MRERMVVQITGEPRAGKSEVANHMAEEYDFTVVVVSDIIRAYADMRDIILNNRASYLEAFKIMKLDLGPNIVADTILEADGDRICTDGNRVPADVDRLRGQAPGYVIALNCPTIVRFQRALALASPLDAQTISEFIEADLAESNGPDREHQMLKTVMAEADYYIDSSQPKEQMLQEVDKIVVPLLG